MLTISCVLTQLLSFFFVSPPVIFFSFSTSPSVSTRLSSPLMSLAHCSFFLLCAYSCWFFPLFLPPLLLPLTTFSLLIFWSECVIPPAFFSESKSAGASEGAGAGGVWRSYGRGGTDPQQQALYCQCWYGHTHLNRLELSWYLNSDFDSTITYVCLILQMSHC